MVHDVDSSLKEVRRSAATGRCRSPAGDPASGSVSREIFGYTRHFNFFFSVFSDDVFGEVNEAEVKSTSGIFWMDFEVVSLKSILIRLKD